FVHLLPRESVAGSSTLLWEQAPKLYSTCVTRKGVAWSRFTKRFTQQGTTLSEFTRFEHANVLSKIPTSLPLVMYAVIFPPDLGISEGGRLPDSDNGPSVILL
ncbi:hypothetical protein WG66_000729, partial [Moniliophthora roreri]